MVCFSGGESDTSQTQARFTTLNFGNPGRELAKIDWSNAIRAVKMETRPSPGIMKEAGQISGKASGLPDVGLAFGFRGQFVQ
jgi:hypothetical protein